MPQETSDLSPAQGGGGEPLPQTGSAPSEAEARVGVDGGAAASGELEVAPAPDGGADASGEHELAHAALEARRRVVSLPPPIPRRARKRTSSVPPPLPVADLAREAPTALERLLSAAPVEPAARVAELEQRIAAAEQAGDKASAAFLSYALGDAAQRVLRDSTRAAKAFGYALKSDPALRANLFAVRRVFIEREMWKNLAQLIAAESRLAGTGAEAAELWVEHGQVMENHLAARDEAIKSYELALERDPGCVSALFALERVALPGNQTDMLARAWRGLADAARDPARKVAYLFDLANLYYRELGDLPRAAAVLAEAQGVGSDSERVAFERELLAARAGDSETVLSALDVEVEAALARAKVLDDPEARKEARLHAAALRRRQGRVAELAAKDLERAWRYYCEAASAVPNSKIAQADLADLAERSGRYDELATLTEEWAAGEGDAARSLGISLTRAQALLRAGKLDGARELLARLELQAPGYLPVLSLREREALERGDDAALAAVWSSIAEGFRDGTLLGVEAGRDETAAAAHFVAAGDAFAKAGDATAAISSYEAALATRPEFPPAAFALICALARNGQRTRAIEVAEKHLPVAADPAPLYEQLALLLCEEGRSADLYIALERWSAAEPERFELLLWREQVLEELGRHPERAELLVELASRTGEPEERAGWLSDAARLYEFELGDEERAVGLLTRAAELWPKTGYAHAALGSLYQRTERWEELVALRREEGVAARREAAHIMRSRLGRPLEAAELLRDCVRSEPDDVGLLRYFIDTLTVEISVDFSPEVAEHLTSALALYAERVEDEARGSALLELGCAREETGDPRGALEAYARAQALGAPMAGLALADLGYRQRDRQAFATGIAALAASPLAAGLPGLGAQAAFAQLFLTGDGAGADSSLAASGAEGTLPAFLEFLLGSAVRDAEATGAALAALGQRTTDQPLAAAAFVRAALYAIARGKSGQAEAHLAAAARAQPESPEVAAAVSEWLGTSAVNPERTPGAELLGRYARACAERAARAAQGEDVRAWQRESAAAWLRAGAVEKAGAIAHRLVANDATDVPSLLLWRRVCIAAGDRAGQAESAAALGLILTDRGSQLRFLREAIAILDGELGQGARAVPLYRRLLVLDPEAAELGRVRAILREHDDVGGLYALLSQRLDASQAGAERAELFLERARIQRRFANVLGADEDLARALDVDPDHPEALWEVAELAMERDDLPLAASTLHEYALTSTSPARRERTYLRIADLYILQGMVDQAVAELLQAAPQCGPAVRERLVEVLLDAGKVTEAIEEISHLRDRREELDKRYRDEMQIGALAKERLQDPGRAAQAFERAFRLMPLEEEPVLALFALASPSVDPTALAREQAAHIRREIAAAPDQPALYQKLTRASTRAQDGGAVVAQMASEILQPSAGTISPGIALSSAGASAPPGERAELDEAFFSRYVRCSPGGGIADELWQAIAPSIANARMGDPSWAALSTQKIKPREIEKRFPWVAAGAHAFAIDGFELHLCVERSDLALATSAERPALYLSPDVAAAESASARCQLGRALAMTRERTGTAIELSADEVAWYFVAASRIIDARVSDAAREATRADKDAVTECWQKLNRDLGRKERKELSRLGPRLVELPDPGEWRRAAEVTAARAGLLLSGDLVAGLKALFGQSWQALARASQEGHAFLGWAASADYLAARARLGWGA